MKKTKIFITALLFIATTATLYATTKKSKSKPEAKFKFGFTVSPLLSTMRTIADKEQLPGLHTPPSLGLAGGITFCFDMPYTKGNLSVITGAMIGVKNYKLYIKYQTLNAKFSSNVAPIEIPFILSLGVPVNKKTYLREFVGLSITYTGSFSVEQATTAFNNEAKDYSVDYQLHYPREFGLQAVCGIGYQKQKFCGKTVDFGLAYHFGLMNESYGEISYRVAREGYKSGISNRGSYLSFNFTVYLKQLGSCPIFR